MLITGVQTKTQIKSFGIGFDFMVDDKLWAVYPVDLSDKGKYAGYAINPDGVGYHVLRGLYLDRKIHLFIRKIRKDRKEA